MSQSNNSTLKGLRLSEGQRLILEEAGIDIPVEALMDRVTAIIKEKKKPRFNAPLRGKLELDWTEKFDDDP